MTATSLLSFKCTWIFIAWLLLSCYLSLSQNNNTQTDSLTGPYLTIISDWDWKGVGRWATVCFTFLQLTPQTEKISLTHHAFQYPSPTNISPFSLSLSLCMYHFFHPLFAPFCANSVLIFPSHETTNSIFLTPDISFTSLFIYFRNWTVDYITSFKLNITYTFSQVIKVMLTKTLET